MEEIMSKHGDFILRLFHNSNLTSEHGLTWFNLFNAI